MEDDEIEREERAIYIIILVALAPVMISLAYHGAKVIDGGTTLSLIIVVCGVWGLGAVARKMRTRVPPAYVVGSRKR